MQVQHLFRLVAIALALAISPAGFAAQAVSQTVEQQAMVDINTADAETLAAVLDGVGLVRAREIVAYREMFGAFRAIEELTAVQGIGPATVERNRHKILAIASD